jgi:hypothetical protein
MLSPTHPTDSTDSSIANLPFTLPYRYCRDQPIRRAIAALSLEDASLLEPNYAGQLLPMRYLI